MQLTCWIIYNGFLQGDKFRDYAEMIQKAAIKRGHEAILYKNNEIISILDERLQVYSLEQTTFPDYVIFTDKDTYLARQLEWMDIPVFNSADTIEISDDKIKTYQSLAAQHIPIPRTIFAPKTFGHSFDASRNYLRYIVEQLGFPLIMKEAFGSFGEQVYLITNETELTERISEIGHKPFMFQQFIDTSYGVDIRLQVVDDQVITAMKRTATDDFRANVTSGGKMDKYEPNEMEKKLAIRASKAIGADFSGVDLLFGKENNPIVCEVNSNAHIRNLLQCTGVNCAHDIIHYIEKKLGAKER